MLSSIFFLQIKERVEGKENYAELIAEGLVKEAAARRTADNTTVFFIDFNNLRRHSSSTH
jgi:serine/threonine protein phosphatase PrpC